MTPKSLLEPEYADAFQTWQADQSPYGNAAFLSAIAPAIRTAVKAHAGDDNPIYFSKGRQLALQAARGYDPTKAKLSTHLYAQLQ